MAGTQGAWNHILHGEVLTALKDVGSSISQVFNSDVAPVLDAFLAQFESDFGKAALTAAASAAAQVASGQKTIVDAGAQLAQTLLQQGLDTAGHDAGTVALNAVGIALHTPATPTPTT